MTNSVKTLTALLFLALCGNTAKAEITCAVTEMNAPYNQKILTFEKSWMEKSESDFAYLGSTMTEVSENRTQLDEILENGSYPFFQVSEDLVLGMQDAHNGRFILEILSPSHHIKGATYPDQYTMQKSKTSNRFNQVVVQTNGVSIFCK